MPWGVEPIGCASSRSTLTSNRNSVFSSDSGCVSMRSPSVARPAAAIVRWHRAGVNGNVTVRQVVLVRGGQEAPRTQGGTKSLGATSLPTAEIVRLGGAGVNAAGAEVGVPQQVYWGVLERIGGYGRRRSSSRPFGRRRPSPLGGGLSPQRGEWSWGSLERTGWQSTMGRAYKRTALAAKRRLTRHV